MGAHRFRILSTVFGLLVALALECGAQSTNVVVWREGFMGHWGEGTNWATVAGDPLPGEGIPVASSEVEIRAGYVLVESQNVAVAGMDLGDMNVLVLSSGRVLGVEGAFNCRSFKFEPASVDVRDGTVNVVNWFSNVVCGLSFELGTNGGNGLLSLGDTWGTTNVPRSDFGVLDRVAINLVRGGLRVAATNISMENNCEVRTAGQPMSFAGNWRNPDGTTRLSTQGGGTGTLAVAGNFDFGRCTLEATVDTNGLSLLTVGGNAVLSNATLLVGASDALTNLAASYDLLRVPTGHTLDTNGMTVGVVSNGGFLYTVSIDANRGGYDYLVIHPDGFLPSVTITNLTEEMLFEAVTNITLQASVQARGAAVEAVLFYADGVVIDGDAFAPYEVNWPDVKGGYYAVTARAFDTNGNVGVSAPVMVSVQGIAEDGRKVFITGGMVLRYEP